MTQLYGNDNYEKYRGLWQCAQDTSSEYIWILRIYYLSTSQGSHTAIEISCETLSLWLCISCTRHSAVTQPGWLLQQPYTVSIGFTSTAKG